MSYNDSRKVFSIAPGKDNEFDSLRNQCRAMFKFGGNVELQMVFQKYDPIWDHYVDVDEEFSVLEDKDKLNLIVQPTLVDSKGSEVSADVLILIPTN